MSDVGKLNVAKYDPRADSSPGTESWRPGYRNDPPGLSGVVLNRQPDGDFRVCPCGCRGHVAGKATFRMGHDMKLKGILIRAHLTGTPVHIVGYSELTEEPLVATRTAFDEAALWTTPKYDWQVMLKEAEAKQGANVREAILRAEREVVARATGPQVGSRRLIRLGRWEYTGLVLAVYRDEGEVLFEYVDRKGRVQQTREALEALEGASEDA